jgi:hypothetical protein
MEACNADRDAIQVVMLCADKNACGKNESDLGEMEESKSVQV